MEKIEHSTVRTNGISMHVASIGAGPTILFLHGFPELWFSWRHHMLSLSALGYRCLAPDLRGYGATDAPPEAASYTALHVVGDLVGLLDHLGLDKVFLVGHDWGAVMAWYMCLFRPDRVTALVNMSVAFTPRNPVAKPVDAFRALLGDDYYICRFQEPGVAEKDFAGDGTANLLKKFFAGRNPRPPCVPKEIGFRGLPAPKKLPAWLPEEDLDVYVKKYNETGFTGGLNYYRALDLTWELTAAWSGVQVKVPTKFIIGDLDVTYHVPGAKEYIHSEAFKRCVPYLQEVVVMEGVAHYINQEKPAETSAHIHAFFSKF